MSSDQGDTHDLTMVLRLELGDGWDLFGLAMLRVFSEGD